MRQGRQRKMWGQKERVKGCGGRWVDRDEMKRTGRRQEDKGRCGGMGTTIEG